MTIKVAIADDHSLVRQGLRRYLDMADGIEVVGEAADGKELLELIGSETPDIALIDIRMPEMDGLEAAREIRDQWPDIGVIMLTAYDDRQFVVEAVRSGARGYVLKARDAEHLIQTVRLVAGGNMVIDPQLVVALAEELSTAKERDRKAETLTAREIEVLQLLAFGHTNRDIAELRAADHLVSARCGSLACEHLLHERIVVAQQLDHETERVSEFQLLEVVVNRSRRVELELE